MRSCWQYDSWKAIWLVLVTAAWSLAASSSSAAAATKSIKRTEGAASSIVSVAAAASVTAITFAVQRLASVYISCARCFQWTTATTSATCSNRGSNRGSSRGSSHGTWTKAAATSRIQQSPHHWCSCNRNCSRACRSVKTEDQGI